MIIEKIPSQSDWDGYLNSLDGQSAYESFFGKSNEEMQSVFFNNVIEAVDELRFTPDIPFTYYVFGLVQYLKSGNFKEYEASDAANCFLNLIRYKLERSPRMMFDLINELLPLAKNIALNQDNYEAPIEVYGDFSEKYKEITQLVEEIAPEVGSGD